MPAAAIEFRKLTFEVLQHANWDEMFTPDYLGKHLRSVVEIIAIEGADQGRIAFNALVDKLTSFSEEYVVFVPILGIRMDDALERRFGDITLHQATVKFLEGIAIPDAAYIKRQTNAFVWAQAKVIAEPERAASRAEEACQPVIDVLRFWMACMAPSGSPCAIGLEGDVVTSERPRIVLGRSDEHKQFIPHRSRLIPGFDLNDHSLKVLREVRIDCLADLIAMPETERSGFVKLVLHALHLFGNSKAIYSTGDRFLNLMMTLEAFLSASGEAVQSVSEGVPMFLVDSVAERIRLKKSIKDLYRIRSRIAHGDRNTVQFPDLCRLEDITKSFLVAMINNRHKFVSRDALIEELERRRLG